MQIQSHDCSVALYADNTAVLYNTFDVTSSSSPGHHPPHPSSDHNCVVDTVGHWTAARCADEHLTVCQSVSGKHNYCTTPLISVVIKATPTIVGEAFIFYL